MNTGQTKRWHNWSGSVQCTPQQIVQPESVAELARMVKIYGQQGRYILTMRAS